MARRLHSAGAWDPIMANTFRDDPYRREHRADEIGVHMRSGAHWPGWLLPLIAVLLLLALIYWAFARRDRGTEAPAFTPQGERAPMQNAVPEAPRPVLPEKPELPDVPKPALPEGTLPEGSRAQPPGAPQGAPPNPPEAPMGGAVSPEAANPQTGGPETGSARTGSPPMGEAEGNQPRTAAEAAAPEQRGASAPRPDDDAAARGATASGFPACAEATFGFSTNDPGLSAADRAKLDAVASCLKENPTQKVRLEGRAQPVSGRPDERTDAMALRRAHTIESELTRRGVQASQLEAISSAPLCTTTDATCAARNRSVTISSMD